MLTLSENVRTEWTELHVAIHWGFSLQTWVSQGISQRGSFSPIKSQRTSPLPGDFRSQRKSRILGPQEDRAIPRRAETVTAATAEVCRILVHSVSEQGALFAFGKTATKHFKLRHANVVVLFGILVLFSALEMPKHGVFSAVRQMCLYIYIYRCTKHISAAQHINFISPKNDEYGDPKIRNRDAAKFWEIQGFCRISTETLGPGNSGKFILGPHLVILEDFLGK